MDSQTLQCIIPGPHLVVDARAAALVVILYNHLLQRRACASERQGATRLGFPPRTPQFQTPKTIRMSEGSAPLRFSSMDSAPAAVPDPPIVAAVVRCFLVSIPPCFSTPACWCGQLTVCQGGFTLSTGTVVLVLRLNEHGGTGFASTRRHLAVASRAGPAGHDRQRRLN